MIVQQYTSIEKLLHLYWLVPKLRLESFEDVGCDGIVIEHDFGKRRSSKGRNVECSVHQASCRQCASKQSGR